MEDLKPGDPIVVTACATGEAGVGERGTVVAIDVAHDTARVTVLIADEELELNVTDVRKLTTSEVTMGALRGRFGKVWLVLLVAFFLVLAVLVVRALFGSSALLAWGIGQWAGVAVAFALFVLFCLIIWVFTRQLNENDPLELRYSLIDMVRLTYTFGFVYLFLVLGPFLFMLPHLFGPGDGRLNEIEQAELEYAVVNGGPFFVTKACSIRAEENTPVTELSELDCRKGSAQWVFNFGGVVDMAGQPTSVEGLQATVSNPVNAQAHVVRLSGGLVVPVYFVFIALAGAVVGMLRRIPEIQRRAYEFI